MCRTLVAVPRDSKVPRMPPQNIALSVTDLVKVFPTKEGPLRAVDGISFEVFENEVFGFLGPNGAGKTTTLEIIEGLQKQTSGHVRVLGLDQETQGDQIKQRIGVQLQEATYFKQLRLNELLDLFGSFFNKKVDPEALLGVVGLNEKRSAKVKDLSGGQARRFSIAVSLVNDPEMIFLDEPTSGLDPQARRHLWDLVEELRSRGKTVVITTHYMDEAEALCDRVAIIDAGKIVALDTPLALVKSLDSAYHIKITCQQSPPVTELEAVPTAVRATSETSDGSHRLDVEVHDPVMAIGAVTAIMANHGIAIQDLRIEPSTLEEVFLSITGRKLRD